MSAIAEMMSAGASIDDIYSTLYETFAYLRMFTATQEGRTIFDRSFRSFSGTNMTWADFEQGYKDWAESNKRQELADSIDDAMALLEKIEKLQKLIGNMEKEHNIGSDWKDNLLAIFGEEGFAEILDELGSEWDYSELMEVMQDRLAKLSEEAGENPFLAMLGLNEEGITATQEEIQDALDTIVEASDVSKLAKAWDKLPSAVQEAIAETYPQILDILNMVEDESEETGDRVAANLEKIRKAAEINSMIKAGSVWADFDDILADIEKGGDKATKAFKSIQGYIYDAQDAMGAMEAAANGDSAALEFLASLSGLTAESLKDDLTPAGYAVKDAALRAGNSAAYLANMLYLAGAVEIDPSGKLVAIGSIEEAAASAGMTVAAFAQTMGALDGAYFTYTPKADGTGAVITAKINPVTWTGAARTASSKSSGKSGGGGGKGGGGGGGSASVTKAIQTMIDKMADLKKYEDYRRELAQLAQAYYQATGELQGVILYLDIERDIVEENMITLEDYLGDLEKEIEAKKAVLAKSKEGSSAYKQAEIDLNALQEKHQEYSKELTQNKTDVVNLTKAIKEQNDTIRQMEIDLRNTILQAIEDREAAEERMLDGRINTENTILGLIKERYERERDEILKTQNLKKDALQEELSQIDELLAARKKLAEEDDKMQKVAELEEKIARISADPTRQKEAMKLREELADLREEIAWDTAEKEAQTQKDSIEQQIKSIDDYIEYVNEYYEDLFKHPQKLIEEMRTIITGTDEEIIEWLKKNSEDYAESTEATQEKMVKDWQDMLDDMNDAIRTYWEEVETIVHSGTEAILDFLMTHTQSYREAGQLQAEAYVDEWKKQLDDLEAAYRQVTGSIESYDYAKVSTSSSSGGGGGGGGGGSTTTTATTTTKQVGVRYQYEYRDLKGNWILAPSAITPERALLSAKSRALEYWQKQGGRSNKTALATIPDATVDNLGFYFRKAPDIQKYVLGGLNTSTGLAWLDGTKARPERILSAYQTELFEDLLQSLHAIRMVNLSPMSAAPKWSGGSATPNIDSIVINVANLDDATNIEEAAEKLMNAFYKKISRNRAVGGIQGW